LSKCSERAETVKYAVVSEYLSPGGVILRAENSEYQPVLVPELTDFQFLDVVAVGVHRLHRVL
jgi:hypothetical protein